MFLSNLLNCCWMLVAWPFWVSISLFRCLKEKHGTGSFSNPSKRYFFKENAHSYRPDPLLDIFGKEVGSGLVGGVTAVREDLISFHREGCIAVLRGISALHHSPSLCAVLNKHKNISHHDLAPLNLKKKPQNNQKDISTESPAIRWKGMHLLKCGFPENLPWWVECTL